jgi:hypothetical protein
MPNSGDLPQIRMYTHNVKRVTVCRQGAPDNCAVYAFRFVAKDFPAVPRSGEKLMSAIQVARSAVLAALYVLGALALAQSLSFSVAAQNVYKSVDEAGYITYTDRPPLNQVNGVVELVTGLDIDRTDDDTIRATNEEIGKQRVAEKQAQQIRNVENAEAATLAAAQKEERAANCKRANRRLTKYRETPRLYRETDDGGREYLSSTELDSARTEAVRSVEEWCG